jgi:hypothetical protein
MVYDAVWVLTFIDRHIYTADACQDQTSNNMDQTVMVGDGGRIVPEARGQ